MFANCEANVLSAEPTGCNSTWYIGFETESDSIAAMDHLKKNYNLKVHMKKIMSGHYQGPSSRPQPASTPGTQGKDAVLGAMHIMEAKYNLFSRFISLVRSVHPESGKQSSSTKLSDMVYHNLNTTQSATVYCELWQFGKLCKTKLMENHKNRRNRSQYHYLGHWKLSHYSTATKFTRWETKRSEKCWVSNNYSYNSVSGNHKMLLFTMSFIF